MSTNKQRRESERLRLQRQLEQRRQKEVARRRFTMIASIVGSLVIVAAIVVVVVVATSGGGKKKPAAAKPSATAPKSPSPSASASAAACGSQQFPTKKYGAAKGASVTFDGVTVKGAKDTSGSPVVTSKSAKSPSKIAYKDLKVGTGTAAGPSSCVTVQYDGVLYKNGTEFDSSWKRGQLAQFPLTGVIPGFTQGIGGTTGVPPMKIGGRRIIIMPAALGYAASPPSGSNIPKNAPLVFVVDLTAVRSS